MFDFKYKKAYLGTATFVLIFLVISTIFTANFIDKPIGILLKIMHQCLFGASFGIVTVFTLHAKLPKQYQILKKLVLLALFLFIGISILDSITESNLISLLGMYSSFYFLSICYLWGINKIKKESYEKLLKYKKSVLYPAILYIFIVSNVLIALHKMYT